MPGEGLNELRATPNSVIGDVLKGAELLGGGHISVNVVTTQAEVPQSETTDHLQGTSPHEDTHPAKRGSDANSRQDSAGDKDGPNSSAPNELPYHHETTTLIPKKLSFSSRENKHTGLNKNGSMPTITGHVRIGHVISRNKTSTPNFESFKEVGRTKIDINTQVMNKNGLSSSARKHPTMLSPTL